MAGFRWFISISGQNVGPLSEEDLRARLKTGAISPATPVWREGLSGWVPLGSSELMGTINNLSNVRVFPQHNPMPRYAPSPEAANPFGGFWIRVIAYLIDCVLLILPQLIFRRMVVSALYGPMPPDSSEVQAVEFLCSIVFWFLYMGVLQSPLEGSLGKRAVGLRLVREDFGSTGIEQTALRYVMLVVGAIPLCAGVFAIGGNSRKQGWHDRVAKTLVVRKEYLAFIRNGQQNPTLDERRAA